MRTSTRSTVVGVFSDRMDAERAIDSLRQQGFRDEQIGIAMRDQQHPEGTVRKAPDGPDGGSTATGAVTGGVLGGVLGALAAGLIPGIGPVLAGGMLAGVLGGAAVGAVSGGLLGALTGMGVPEEDARYYDEEFRGGRTIVTVKADERYDEARAILQSHGAHDVESRQGSRGNIPQSGRFASTDTTSSRPAQRTSGDRTLELREEELRVGKERVEAGRVEVEKDIETERRTIDVPTMREEAIIERHPVDRRPADGPISDREEIEIPLREDR